MGQGRQEEMEKQIEEKEKQIQLYRRKEDAEAARLYFQALRSLNVASLGISHTNKQGGLFGTTFFGGGWYENSTP